MRRGAWVVLGVVLLAALMGWWLADGGSGTSPPAPEASNDTAPGKETEAKHAEGPLLHVGAGEASAKDLWLTVSVVEAPGDKPLANTEFYFSLRRADAPGRESFLIAKTDEEGKRRIGPLATADIEVWVSAREHRKPPGWLRPERDSTGNLTLAVALERGLSITGRVELPESVPARAVHLTIHMGNARFTGIDIDDDGSFARPGLDPGRAEIRVIAAHGGKRFLGHAETEAGAAPVAVQLVPARIGDRTFARIRIEDPQGEPAAALVEFEQVSHEFRQWGGSTRVLGESEIKHDYRPEASLFVFATPNADSGLGEAVVGPLAADTTRVVVRLAPARSVRGLVVDVSGVGVARATVTLAMVHPSPERTTASARPAVSTDESGRFECGGLGDHEYVMTVAAPPKFVAAKAQRVRAGTQDVHVVLREGMAAQVSVFDTDGSPVPEAAVTASILGGNEAPTVTRATTDAKGRCVLTGLAEAGTYRLHVRPPAPRTDLLMHVREEWSPGSAEIRLDRAHTISGRLRTSDGKPLAGVWIRCTGVGMPHGGARVLNQADGSTAYQALGARTGTDGSFTISRLKRGRYELIPKGAGDAPVTVEAGATEVNLTAPLMLDLNIQILDWNLEDRGKTMQMRGAGTNGSGLPRRIDAEGRVGFGKGDATRSYEVWIGDLAGGRYVWSRSISASDEHVEVQPQVGGTARGRVIVPEGVKFEELTVHAGGPISGLVFPASGEIKLLGAFGTTIDQATGKFEITGLPPGVWSIQVWLDDGEDFYTADARIHAGDDAQVRLKKE